MISLKGRRGTSGQRKVEKRHDAGPYSKVFVVTLVIGKEDLFFSDRSLILGSRKRTKYSGRYAPLVVNVRDFNYGVGRLGTR